MNASTSAARALLAEFARLGVRDYVLAPGSRNAPLSLALAAAEARHEIRLHVRMDERSAGFLALGLARGSGSPVVVVTTSGTAAVELHPAVVEASHGGVPLIAVTADRPVSVRGSGASQTIDQVGLFGTAVRFFVDLPEPSSSVDYAADVASALSAALGACGSPGPVHLNLPLRPPLVPGPEDQPAVPLVIGSRRAIATPEPEQIEAVLARLGVEGAPERGLILLGDTQGAPGIRAAAIELGSRIGWPVLSEASGGGPGLGVLPHGSLLLAAAEFAEHYAPELLLTVGTFGLSREVLDLATDVATHVAVRRAGLPADPVRSAVCTLDAVPTAVRRASGSWLAAWTAAATAADRVVAERLSATDLTGLAAAREVWDLAPKDAPLLVAASWSVRILEAVAAARFDPPEVVCNRGTNGIDGLLATAWGVTVGRGRPGLALVGDLAFLYDHNGLLAPAVEPRPDLVIVVIDNDGGGIFHQLEQGRPEYSEHFERVFGTPHGLDLVAVAAAAGVPAVRVRTRSDLRATVAEAMAAGGVHVVVAAVGPRAGEWAELQALQDAVARAVC